MSPRCVDGGRSPRGVPRGLRPRQGGGADLTSPSPAPPTLSCMANFLGAPRPGSGEEELEVVAGQVGDQAVVGVEDGVGEVALALLELEDLLLDGVAADQAVGEDVLGL